MRLPYIPQDVKYDNEQDQKIVERVRERRGGTLFELDQALLYSPPVTDGWNSFLGAIRTRTTLSISIRELAICRVAVLNRAWYEWGHHAPILLSDPAMTQAHVDAVLNTPPRDSAGGALDEQHDAVLAYTDAMTLDVSVPDAVFAKLKKNFSDKEVVEVTATVSAYNCVSRFLVALHVGEETGLADPRTQ